MRGITATAVFLLAQAIAQPGLAQGGSSGLDLALGAPRHVQTCTVTAVDTVSMNFVCQTNRTTHRFWLARSTQFSARGPNASPFQLRTGQRVQVTFHNAGRQPVADSVSL